MSEAIPVVGQREPCPCGSTKRYKNCHGRDRDQAVFIARPFEGVNGEAELLALSELLASATAEVKVQKEIDPSIRVTFCTLLPGSAAAFRAAADSIVVGLQTTVHSPDRSADIAGAILTAAQASVGEFVAATPVASTALRLQDLLDPGTPVVAAVHNTFNWWRDHDVISGEDEEMLADMNASFVPATRIAAAAYFLPSPERPQVRMVLPDDEVAGTDAFARLVASGGDSLADGSRWLGNFRTCGLLAPVWDVPQSWDSDQAQTALSAFLERYEQVRGDTTPLTSQQRQARAAVVGKFVTVR
jgi:hypothetical protein